MSNIFTPKTKISALRDVFNKLTEWLDATYIPVCTSDGKTKKMSITDLVRNSDFSTLQTSVLSLTNNKTDRARISSKEFSSTITSNVFVGELAWHEDSNGTKKLYWAKEAISSGSAWDSSKWDEVTISDVIVGLTTIVTNLNTNKLDKSALNSTLASNMKSSLVKATEDELTSSNNLLLQVGNALKSLPADKVAKASNGTDQIHSIADTATEADLVAGNYFVLDGANGKKKLGAEKVAGKESFGVVEDVKYFTTENGLSSGYYINRNGGAATPLSIYSCTDFVCVEPGSFVTCLFLSSDAIALCFYKDDKTFISALTCSDGLAERTFEVPSNARFVRFSCKTSDVPTSGLYIKTQKEYYSIKKSEIEKTFLERRYLKVGSGLEDGKYLVPNGGTVSLSPYATSSYLDVVGNEEISVFSTINSNVALCFYNENKLFISSVVGGDLESLGYSSVQSAYRTFTVPKGARYVRFSVMKKEMFEDGCIFARSSFRCKLQSQINDLEPSLYKDTRLYTVENGLIDERYIEGDYGREVSNASYCASGFICIKGSKFIKVGCSITTASNSIGLCFYTKGGGFISSVCGTYATSKGFYDGFEERLFEVPSNAYHVRFCALKSKIPSYGCKLEIMSQPVGSNDEVSNTPYELLIHKVCFLGDSLTVGADYSSGSYGGNMQTNYPYYLSRMGNFEHEVKAHAGDSAKNCWDSFVKNLDCTQYDCFVIWLGTNYGLTDSLDNDVIPYESYTDFADTNTGCYCKIISKIITQNPTAKIFLGGIYTTGGGATLLQTNRTIGKISNLERYSNNIVGVCWMNDYEIYNQRNQSAVLHPGGNGVHFGKVGNFVVAKYWLENIRMLMAAKLSMFEYPRIV